MNLAGKARNEGLFSALEGTSEKPEQEAIRGGMGKPVYRRSVQLFLVFKKVHASRRGDDCDKP